MDYHLKVRPWIDNVFVFTTINGKQTPFGMMQPAEDYETMTLSDTDIKMFNITLPSEQRPNSKTLASFNMLAYGIGGTGEYNLTNLLSEPINPESIKANVHMSNIVVNTPLQINAVLIEFPKVIQDLLNINKWLWLIRLDKKTFKENNKFDNHDLMARGVDPAVEAKTYVGQLLYTLPAWSSERPEDFTTYKHIYYKCALF